MVRCGVSEGAWEGRGEGVWSGLVERVEDGVFVPAVYKRDTVNDNHGEQTEGK